MNTPYYRLARRAEGLLQDRWMEAILVFLVYVLLNVGINFLFDGKPFFKLCAQLSSSIIFPLGLAVVGLALARQQPVKVEMLFEAFKHLGRALAAALLTFVPTLLGFLVFIIPGIIVSLGLSMTFFIMADDRSISALDAVKKSWEMMKGNKMELFRINLLCVGLSFVCILTFGVGFLFLIPYYYTLIALFYDDIKPSRLPVES